MTTRTSHNVGASNINPGTAVTTTAGTAVPAPGTVVPSFATATGVAAVKTVREGLVPLETVLGVYLQDPTQGTGKRNGSVSKRRTAIIPLLLDLLHQYPSLGPGVQPAVITQGISAADGLDMLATDLLTLHARVKANATRVRRENWSGAGSIYANATYQAKTDPALKGKVAPIKAALKQGPRVDTTAAAISGTAHTAAKAQARATRSQQKATNVIQAHARAVAAANSRVRGTSPVPLANPQGPAASADVAPQGPAPGR